VETLCGRIEPLRPPDLFRRREGMEVDAVASLRGLGGVVRAGGSEQEEAIKT